MKKTLFIFAIIFAIIPVGIFAKVHISSLLPNPEKPLPEQITVQNFGCEVVNIENFEIRKTDTNKKQIFPKIFLASGEDFVLEIGNFLKNSGDVIEFFDANNEKIEEISFWETQKWEKISYSHEMENCEKITEKDDNDAENPQIPPIENPDETKNNENEENPLEMLEPEKWVFSLSDEKNFFTIFYGEILTGSLDVSKIQFSQIQNDEKFIFSGAIFSGSVDQNTLILEFSPEKIPDFDVKNLKIFSEENFGIVAISGKKLKNFDENSFENYTKIELEEIAKIVENIGENPDNEAKIPEIENNIFPEISPFLQRATDAVLEENIFYCTKKPCRINLNFEEIFSSEFPKEKFSCTLKTENQAYRLCNPPQISFDKAENFTFELTEKSSGKIFAKNFLVDFSKLSLNVPQNFSRIDTKYYAPPVVKIISQGKFENEYKWLSDAKIECFASPCSLNFSASGSFSPEKFSLKYFWKFGENIEKTGRNPSAVSLETGKYAVLLMVQDSKWVTSSKEISVFVPDKKRDEEAKKEEKISKNSQKTEKILEISENEKMDFSAVELVLQNPKNFQTDDENFYLCISKTGECSVNFTLENATKNMRFYWGWDNEVAFESKNPRSKNLGEGEHTLIIQGFETKNLDVIRYEKRVVVRVEKFIPPPKSPKKSTKKTTKKSAKKSEEKTEIPTEKEEISVDMQTEDKEEKFSEMFFASGILLFSLAFWGYRRRKNGE